MSTQNQDVAVSAGHCAGPEIALRALSTGEKKAQLAFMPTLLLGILAGIYIGLGSNFFTIVKTGSPMSFGVQQALGGLAFSLGLILVVIGGAELFTGNALIVMAWLSGRVSTRALLRNWSIVYLGNLLGSLLLVWLVFQSAQYLLADQAVAQTALKVAAAKCSLPFGVVLARGVLCNALVCLAVWMCYSGCSTTDKIVAIIFPITAFVAGGFEHCVANMYLVPLGLALKWSGAVAAASDPGLASLTLGGFIWRNLVPSTIGNIIGGAVMVGGVYWAAYVLPSLPAQRRPGRHQRDIAHPRQPEPPADNPR
jgi:formate transporter